MITEPSKRPDTESRKYEGGVQLRGKKIQISVPSGDGDREAEFAVGAALPSRRNPIVRFLRPLPMFVFPLIRFSGDSHKRVLDAKSANLLPRIQIFREEPCRAAFGGGRDDEGIPEADPRFVFNAECHRKLGWSGFHAPDGVTADHEAGRLLWQGRANLAGYVCVEFLQDLDAQNTRACGPKLTQNVFGDRMFRF